MRSAITAALVIASVANIPGVLTACGDKFLVPVRATRYTTPPPKRESAALLVYASPSSEMARMMNRHSVARTLQKAGYQVTETASEPQLASALSQRRWDLIVMDFDDLGLVAGRDGTFVTALLPVSYNLRGTQWTNARQQYPRLVNRPEKAQNWLEAVDAALESTRAARGRAQSQ